MSSYETQTATTTTTTTTSASYNIGCQPEYLKTIPGILKIVEIVLSILVLICQSIRLWAGGGWVEFVAIVALICTTFLLVLYMTGLRGKFPQWFTLAVLSLLTFICACVWHWYGAQDYVLFVALLAFFSTLLLLLLHLFNLISRFPGPWLLVEFIYYCVITFFYFIAAIVSATKWTWHSSIAATCFFAFCATAVYAADTFIQFRVYRSGQTDMAAHTQSTKTTTTVESQQY